MAVKVYDGFDHYAAQADLQSRVGALQWSDIVPGSGLISMTTGRGGYGQSIAISGNSVSPAQFGGSFNANYGTSFIGLALLLQPVGCPHFDIRLMDYTFPVAQMTFRCFPDSGLILVYNGDPDSGTGNYNLLASTPPNAFSPYIWNYIEIGTVISNSGSFDFHVNGNSVISGSGVKTNSPAVGLLVDNFLNGIRITWAPNASGTGTVAQIDDFYLCDNTTGGGTYACNTFLGDVACRTLKTTANSSVQWTPLTSTNWVEVGETQFDGDTSYNYSTTVTDEDLFTFGSLPTTISAVFAVQVTGAYRKLDASAQTVIQKLSSGGTVASGATLTLSLSYAYYTDLVTLDPHTSATWTPTAVNAALGGYYLNS